MANDSKGPMSPEDAQAARQSAESLSKTSGEMLHNFEQIRGIMSEVAKSLKDAAESASETKNTQTDTNDKLLENIEYNERLKGIRQELLIQRQLDEAVASQGTHSRERGNELEAELNRILEDRLGTKKQIEAIENARLTMSQGIVGAAGKGIKNQFNEYIKGSTGGAEAAGIISSSGAPEGISKLISSVTAEIPFGGLLGLMFYGRSKEFEYQAEAQKVIQQFDTIKGGAGKFGSEVMGTIREYSAKGMDYIVGDLTTISHTLRSVGEDGTFAMAFERVDKAMELSAGTAAKWAAEMKTDFASSLRDSGDAMGHMASMSRDLSVSQDVFINDIIRASSSLRGYRIDIMDVAKVAKSMNEEVARHGFGGDDNSSFREKYTSEVMGKGLNALASMNMGVAAVLGAKAGITGNGGIDVAEQVQSQIYARGENRDNEKFMKIAAAAVDMARSQGRDDASARLFLKSIFGTDRQGAEGIFNIGTAYSRGDTKAAAAGVESFDDAMKTESQKIDKMTQILGQMRDAVAHIGSAILDTLVAGFRSVVHLVEMYTDTDHADEYKEGLAEDVGRMKKGYADFGKYIGVAVAAMGNGASDLIGKKYDHDLMPVSGSSSKGPAYTPEHPYNPYSGGAADASMSEEDALAAMADYSTKAAAANTGVAKAAEHLSKTAKHKRKAIPSDHH